jgi:ADP-ribose pyrophosphatase
MKPWTLIDTHSIGDFHIFSMQRQKRLNPRTDREQSFFVIHSTDWINVIAITPDGQVVLIRQFRAGTNNITVEIPGGMVDSGEDPREAAIRELREETGYVGDSVTLIGMVHPNPAFLDNQCHTYLIENATRKKEQSLDSGEDIEVFTTPLSTIPHLIHDGTITHALVVAAFAHLERAG